MKHSQKIYLWLGLMASAAAVAVLYSRTLPTATANSPGLGQTIVVQPRLGDRLFVASVLREVFGPSEEARLIAERPEVFGGFCDPYSLVRIAPGAKGFANGAGDCGEQGSYQPSEQNPPSVVRQGYLIRACESLVGRPENLARAMAQLPGEEINPISLTAAFQLFFPERKPSASLLKALAKIPGADARNRWRGIFKVLCSDPSWQVI